MDLISVIVPIYQVEKYLRRCVESICAQTYRELEIILVDDGSLDGCPAICDEYAGRDPRVRAIHQKNGGVSSARNAGLDMARGAYIGFVDGDDYIEPNMYETLHERIVRADADMAICGIMLEHGDGGKGGKETECFDSDFVADEEMFWNMFYHNQISIIGVSPCNKLYRRALFREERFDLGCRYEDELILQRILCQCGGIACLKMPLYHYVMRADSFMHSRTLQSYRDALAIYRLREDYLAKRGFSGIRPYVIWGYLGTLFRIWKLADKQDGKRILAPYRQYLRHTCLSLHKEIPARIRFSAWLFLIYPGLYGFEMEVYERCARLFRKGRTAPAQAGCSNDTKVLQ